MKLIVGLGNPGIKYKHTRHNAGFLVVDWLVEQFDKKAKWQENPSGKFVRTNLTINGLDYEFIKPLTYMNNSGQAVKSLTEKYRLTGKDVCIIHDELDLPFGEVRFKTTGSSAGHNGIKSIIAEFQTEEFNRIRIGISNEQRETMPAEKFVLSKFSRDERKKLKDEIFKEVEQLIFN